MLAHPLSLGFPTHSADRNWYHLWTGDLFGSWKLPLFPCPGSTWTGLLIPRVRKEEMPKPLESQEEADTGSWKVPVPRCSQQNTPGLRLSCLRDGPTLIFPLHFSAPRGDPEGSLLVSRQMTGEPHRPQKTKTSPCEEGAAAEHEPSFLGPHSGSRLSTAPSRKWALSGTLDHGLFSASLSLVHWLQLCSSSDSQGLNSMPHIRPGITKTSKVPDLMWKKFGMLQMLSGSAFQPALILVLPPFVCELLEGRV